MVVLVQKEEGGWEDGRDKNEKQRKQQKKRQSNPIQSSSNNIGFGRRRRIEMRRRITNNRNDNLIQSNPIKSHRIISQYVIFDPQKRTGRKQGKVGGKE